ncbi:multiubiquitin domain-containing protein [Phaeovulum sp.]|uniref:multiubiquitin domain-containing protein n=1 Tax=Phaeovulum sp. TaxID=2934796 RepID=UPI0035676B28
MAKPEEHPKPEPKTVTIVVNGREKTVPKNDDLTFAEVIALAFENPPNGDGVQFTIQYTRGNDNKPAGSLVEGQSVKAKEGMEFDVTPTNRS